MCLFFQTFCPCEALLSNHLLTLLCPCYFQSVVAMNFSYERCLFCRLEEVLVMGMRMTEGITHKVKCA